MHTAGTSSARKLSNVPPGLNAGDVSGDGLNKQEKIAPTQGPQEKGEDSGIHSVARLVSPRWQIVSPERKALLRQFAVIIFPGHGKVLCC